MLVFFHTNLDDYIRCKWPKELSCRPQIGDYVESSTGKELKICKIVHGQTML